MCGTNVGPFTKTASMPYCTLIVYKHEYFGGKSNQYTSIGSQYNVSLHGEIWDNIISSYKCICQIGTLQRKFSRKFSEKKIIPKQ